MAALTFNGSDALMLLAHAKASKEHTAGYLELDKPGPGLMLVKDSGVYLMSNGRPGLKRDDGAPGSKVVYAHGLAPAAGLEGSEWDQQYDKINSVSPDDFTEFLEAPLFDKLQPEDQVRIELIGDQMKLSFLTYRKRS